MRKAFWHNTAMTFDLFTALVGFAFATSVTPGPNNMMMLASGANFGFRRSVPHLLGISLGHGLMVFLVGLGLAQVFQTLPVLGLGIKIVSVVYMLWLAWKIAHAAAPQEGKVGGKPFSFLQAAAFQWVNPKAWAMALTAVTVYAGGQGAGAMLTVAVVFLLVNLPSVSVWIIAGQQVRRWLTTNRRLQVFNWTMAVLLVASLWPVLRL
jgi:threonine/homoserine/homoserine lactone efflux protein